ncbi:MAG: hypothetical protein IKY21_02710, partial [Clostridia bacterium]|nr:hypothetical protein [Clostridia bacterium]
MKKFLSLLLVAVLVSAIFAVPVSADDEYFWAEGEYTVDDSGNWHPNNAWGYVFNIDALNTLTVDGNAAITGIFTNVDDYLANAGGKNAKWKAHVILAPTEEANVYEVVQGYEYTGKTAQDAVNEGIVNFDGGKIILMASDSGTRPDKNDDGALLFPNWEDRAACWGLVKTIGAKLTLAGVDLAGETGACTGTLTVEADPSKVEDEGNFESKGTILVDAVNAASWAEGSAIYGTILVYGTENTVSGYIGGVWNGWWIKLIAEYDEATGLFEVIEKLPNDGDQGYATRTLGEGQVMLLTYTGTEANERTSCDTATAIEVGDLLSAEGFDFTNASAADIITMDGDNFVSTVSFTHVAGAADEEGGEVTEITNVALDKEYTVSGAGDYVETYVGNLTDGVVGEDLSEGKEQIWYALYHNGDRPNNAPDKLGYFIIDLEDEFVLSNIKVNFINNTGWGIPPAEYAKAYVSLDGNAYEEVGEFEISSEEGVAFWSEVELDAKAKFVKIEVKLGGTFAFLSEIEVYGGKPGAGGSTEPKEDVEAEMKELLGAAPTDAKVDYVIEAPESYEAGDEITVTVTVKNITAENGIHVAAFKLLYDN